MTTKKAGPYQARHCDECDTWIYTDAAPFAENDRTKTLRDWLHYEKHHLATAPLTPNGLIGFPAMRYNTEPVDAELEDIEGGTR